MGTRRNRVACITVAGSLLISGKMQSSLGLGVIPDVHSEDESLHSATCGNSPTDYYC
jgi:hypothetical protein